MPLTNQQKIQAYQFALRIIKAPATGAYSPCICIQLHRWLMQFRYVSDYAVPIHTIPEFFPELMLKRPSNAKAIWWGEYDRKSRIKCLESLILELSTPQSNDTLHNIT